MNKLLIACMSAAFALSVNAADWFNGGLSSAKKAGGDWAEGTTVEGGTIALTPESGEVAFTVAEGSEKSLDTDVVTITSTVALTAYDELPEVVSGTKAALAPVDDGETVAYYGLVSGKFVKLTGATPKDEAVTVTIQMRKVLGQTQVKYSVDETDLQDENGNTWIYTNVTDAPTEVAYSGTGTVSNLEGATDAAEYLTAANPTISDAAGLAAVAKTAADFNGLAGQTVTLGADIALEGTVTPIGAGAMKDKVSFKMPGEDKATITTQAEAEALADAFKATAFKGTFDGAGYTISNVVLPRQDYTGLFGSTYGATIKNLKVACAGFAGGTTDCGGAVIAGVTVDTTIQDCEVSGAVTATKAIAGISGYACSGTVIKDCVNKANLTTANEKIGGMVGCAQNGATGMWGTKGVEIDGCTNEGDLTCTTSGKTFLGGLVTYADSTVTFKGDNVVKGTLTQTGGSVSSVAAPNSGTIVLDDGTTFQVPAAYKTTVKSGKAVDGLQLATVSEGVATLVKAADVTAGNTYKVMAAGAAPVLELAAGESVAFDTTLATITDTGITAAAGYKVTKATEDNITTYTAVEAAVGFTITIAENTSATIKIGEAEAVDAATVSKIPEGADYVVTYSPADGYMFAAGTETQVSGTADEDVELEGPTALAIVATVDGTTYASMADAIEAAIAAGKPLTPAEGQVVVAPAGFDAQVDPETGAVTFVAKTAVAAADGYLYADVLPTTEAYAVKICDGTLADIKDWKFAAKVNGANVGNTETYADEVVVYETGKLSVQCFNSGKIHVVLVDLVEKNGAVYAYQTSKAHYSRGLDYVGDKSFHGTGSAWVTPSADNMQVVKFAAAPTSVAMISSSFDGDLSLSKKTVSFAQVDDNKGKFAGCYDTESKAAKTTNRPWSAANAKLFTHKERWSVLTTAKLATGTVEKGVIWSLGNANNSNGISLVQKGESVTLQAWDRANAENTVVLAEGNVKGGTEAYNTIVVVANEYAETDKYTLYIDGDKVAASGDKAAQNYGVTGYQFGDTFGTGIASQAANTGVWLDEFETFNRPLSAEEVLAASLKFNARVDNSVLTWDKTEETVITDETLAENVLGNGAPIGGATELVFNANATISIADDCTLKNFTVNDGTISLKKGSSSSALNDETFTLNGGKLYFTWGEKAANVSGTVILNGGTIEGTDNWPGLNGTLTLVTQKDTSLINSSGDAKTLGGGKIIKQGAADLTINTTCGAWSDDGFGQVELVIEEGKVLLRKNVNHTLAKVTGAGTLVLDGGSLTVTDPTDVATIVPTAAAIEAGKVIKTEELEGGAVKYTVVDAVLFTKAETITVGDMNGYYQSGKTEADAGCYAVVGQLASAETEFSLTVGETVVNDTDTISVSIGNNVMMTTKYFTVAEDGTLSVANVILAVEDVKVTVGGTDYVLATTPSGTLTVDSVVSNGSVNKVTAESDGSFKIVAKTTHEYISINFADQAGTTAYITKKTYNWPGYQPSSTYGITPPESDKGELALYPCGWADPDVVADYWEGATLEYMAYAVGKGSALVTLKYTKKDVEPVDPETPSEPYADKATAEAAAAAINADKANLIKTPAGVDKANYVANFEAVVTDDNKVVVQLTAAAEEAVQQAVDDAQETVLNPDENGKATIVAKPGFYYGIAAVSELDAMEDAQPASWTMAESTELKLEVTKPSPTKGFYRVMSTVKPPVAE